MSCVFRGETSRLVVFAVAFFGLIASRTTGEMYEPSPGYSFLCCATYKSLPAVLNRCCSFWYLMGDWIAFRKSFCDWRICLIVSTHSHVASGLGAWHTKAHWLLHATELLLLLLDMEECRGSVDLTTNLSGSPTSEPPSNFSSRDILFICNWFILPNRHSKNVSIVGRRLRTWIWAL